MSDIRTPLTRRRTWASLLTLATCVGIFSPAGIAHAAPGADTDAVAPAAENHTIAVDITPSQVTLSEGEVLEVYGNVSKLAPTIDSPLQNAVEVRAEGGVAAEFAYHISMLGEPTPYWVKMNVTTTNFKPSACSIFVGDPSAGGNPADAAPFSCTWARERPDSTESRYRFTVRLNRDAEASGTITPHEVALTDGTFRSDLPYTIPGKTELEPRESTDFDTIHRQTDTSPFYANQARIEFAYQIVDDGKPTGLWAAGLSTNHRGASFSADSRCAIYDKNPLRSNGHLDWAAPIESDKYYCTSSGHFVSGDGESGRLHYHANFMVRGR